MPELREALEDAGFEDVKTYLQSGNVVLSSKASAKGVARENERLIAERFGLDVKVVVRTRDELAEIVNRNPLGKVAKEPEALPGELSGQQARSQGRPQALRRGRRAGAGDARRARALRLAPGGNRTLKAGCAACWGRTRSRRDGAKLDYSYEAARDGR